MNMSGTSLSNARFAGLLATVAKTLATLSISEDVAQSWENNGAEMVRRLGFLAEKAPTAKRSQNKIPRRIIDCDADPIVPNSWSVEEHKKGGQLNWNMAAVKLWLSQNQLGGKCIKGNQLRKELTSLKVLNSNVLDFLLANQHFIPEEWKDKKVFFWGTVYRLSGGHSCVRCLYWGGGRWGWDAYLLDCAWGGVNPALVSRKEH
jgi:hypothetical protein